MMRERANKGDEQAQESKLPCISLGLCTLHGVISKVLPLRKLVANREGLLGMNN